MRISLIMPTYNRDFIIELAIQSIIHQEPHESEVELFIGDDGTDQTEEIINNIDNTNPRLTIHYEKMERIALSDKLNYLVRKSTGDYYGIIGSDDFQSPYKITGFEKALSQKGGDVFGQYKFIYHDIIFSHSKIWTQNRDLDFFKAGSFLIMKRSIFDQYDGYDPGLWRAIDSSLAEKIDWEKVDCTNVEDVEPKVIQSSIAIQHIDNIWRRKSKGFRRKQKQTANYLTQSIDLNLQEEMGSVYPTYHRLREYMVKDLSILKKIFLILKK